ncbi:DMT family transporter [Oenococcus kitaharae]|uniref:Integral membrane protein n=1 Tax=Oenococcus kitaharae DSM 17330 TaxID=1045004 RepID=G9WH80_9LACO|nr:DMT family transporter [Oenococcus kitaharae]EHN59646.1 Integral membrane protein [Oenococcus kitaharae DSM 17330]OEY83489.1 membrane protein [Oenococcus kitaharae]OEY85288.1 membrane protein [Oenococcus kitaharae]OEY86142.1 membrane protein [Oenococcus kitaharae]
MFAIIIGLSIGVGLPIQTAINSRLRTLLASPLLSSMISFTIGAAFLLIVNWLVSGKAGINLSLAANQPFWIWTGGIFGVIFLTGNILLFPKLGSVQTVIMPIVGQIVMSMLIDNFGWFFSPKHTLGFLRVIGALLLLAGVFLAVAARDLFASIRTSRLQQARPSSSNRLLSWVWRVSGFVIGMFSATQTAINGHLGIILHSPIKSALVSFVVGTVVLWLLVLIVEHGYHLSIAAHQKAPWWIWIGGLIGALFVLGNAYLVPLIGTGLTVVVVLLGQIAGSMLVDQFGWFAAKKNPVDLAQIAGIVLMVAGVALIKLF